MLILALDATALAGSVALCEDERLLAEFTIQTGNTHSETLLPMVESVLRMTGRAVDDIDLFACTQGPGSFTGVRIGAATIKGLAFGKNKPCIGVSTLESLAYNGIMMDGILCPAINARRGQVFNALFEANSGVMTRLFDDRALPVTELLDGLGHDPACVGKPIWLMGDGADMIRTAAGATSGLQLKKLPERLIPASGYSTAQCARMLYERGVRTTDAELTPVYLRMSQAERVRNENLQRDANDTAENR